MIKVTLAFDTDKTAKEFTFTFLFTKLIVPIINLNQCIWFEITDDLV